MSRGVSICVVRATPSTRVYCLPTCPSRARDSSWFLSVAAAESAGFRPCLRCRPELLVPALDGPEGWCPVRRAAAWIREHLSLGTFPALAARLGCDENELRCHFNSVLGASPEDVLLASQLHFARLLLSNSTLPDVTIAKSAGLGSARELHRLLGERYELQPSDLRPASSDAEALGFPLTYQAPLDWTALLDFLRVRAIPGVEDVTAAEYRRTLRIAGTTGWLAVSPGVPRHTLQVRLSPSLLPVLPRAVAAVSRLFDLSARPDEIAPVLGELDLSSCGLRVPGAADPLEMSVRAVLGQQITVQAARTLARRLVEHLGAPVDTPFRALTRVFPDAAALDRATQDELGRLGILRMRVAAIQALAKWQLQDEFALSPWLEPHAGVATMKAFPGIGDWTAHYIAMRALKWGDAFPAADYGVRSALNLSNSAAIQARAAAWRPWRAYAVMHLWRQLS